FGGLGILNTRVLNESLLLKWVWKMYNADEKDICCNLLRAKYLKKRGLQKVKHKFYLEAAFSIGNGENTRFWIDTWLGDVPLKLEFPRLFACCRSRDIVIRDCWEQDEWDVSFKRTFGPAEVREWNRLLQWLDGVHFSDQPDQAVWKLERKG
ncbi:hypothetical protein PVAP13_4KG200833, partial [Panicum virgatum]